MKIIKWTQNKPKEPGYYYLYDPWLDKGPDLVHISKDGEGLGIDMGFYYSGDDIKDIGLSECWWYGPITEPNIPDEIRLKR